MIRDLGIVRPGTTLYIPFHTFDSNDPSASVTLTGLATSDVEIYKDGSVTQRASDNGYALLDTDGIDFDGVTGIHGLSIDLADNTTAGFYAAGSQYWVVIASVTVDAATVNFILATFRIGYPAALLNTTIATLASQTSFTLTVGPAEDDALNGMWCCIHDVASAVQAGWAQILDYTGSTKTVTLAAGTTFTAAATDNFALMGVMPLQPATTGRTLLVGTAGQADGNVTQFGGSNGTFSGGRPEVNTSHAAGTAWGSGAITSGVLAADAITAAKLHNDVTTELQSGLATSSALSSVAGDVTSILGKFTGITLLAQWLGLIAGKQTGNSTARTELRATGAGSGTFDETTDSLEAVRDNVGTAGAGLTAVGDTAGTTTLLSRLTSTRAGYLDNLSAGAVATAAKLLSYFQSALRKDVTVDADIGGNYDDATDSQEAIRDRGDSAWTTATGFSTHSAADVWAVGTRELTAFSASFKTGYALSSAGVQAIWDALTSALTTVGSIGKLLVDNINAAISSRASQTSVDDVPTNSELATALAAADDAVLAQVALVKATTDKLDDTLEDDGGTYRFTENALEEAPGGGSAPTAAEIANAVWDEDLTGHTTPDSAGDTLGNVATGTPPTAAAIADAVWDEATAGHTTSGTFGEQLKTDVDAILADTNELQVDWVNGGRLDNILDARASQASVDDVPTNAELATALAGADDATLAAIAGLNNLSQANIRTAVGLASANLDTQLGDLPTNAELAASQASADDATLAAIAALTIPTAAANATAVLAAAASNPINANIKEVNDVPITGTGVTGDSWVPD
jgi:hypothetical protein